MKSMLAKFSEREQPSHRASTWNKRSLPTAELGKDNLGQVVFVLIERIRLFFGLILGCSLSASVRSGGDQCERQMFGKIQVLCLDLPSSLKWFQWNRSLTLGVLPMPFCLDTQLSSVSRVNTLFACIFGLLVSSASFESFNHCSLWTSKHGVSTKGTGLGELWELPDGLFRL